MEPLKLSSGYAYALSDKREALIAIIEDGQPQSAFTLTVDDLRALLASLGEDVPVEQQRQIIPHAIADTIEDALIELLTTIAVDRCNGHVEHEQYIVQRRRAVEAQNWLRMQGIRDA